MYATERALPLRDHEAVMLNETLFSKAKIVHKDEEMQRCDRVAKRADCVWPCAWHTVSEVSRFVNVSQRIGYVYKHSGVTLVAKKNDA